MSKRNWRDFMKARDKAFSSYTWGLSRIQNFDVYEHEMTLQLVFPISLLIEFYFSAFWGILELFSVWMYQISSTWAHFIHRIENIVGGKSKTVIVVSGKFCKLKYQWAMRWETRNLRENSFIFLAHINEKILRLE